MINAPPIAEGSPACSSLATGHPTSPGELADRINAARYYAELGYPVFPCWEGEKKPLTKNGRNDATLDVAKIEQWFSKNPEALQVQILVDAVVLFEEAMVLSTFGIPCERIAQAKSEVEKVLAEDLAGDGQEVKKLIQRLTIGNQLKHAEMVKVTSKLDKLHTQKYGSGPAEMKTHAHALAAEFKQAKGKSDLGAATLGFCTIDLKFAKRLDQNGLLELLGPQSSELRAQYAPENLYSRSKPLVRSKWLLELLLSGQNTQMAARACL